MAITPLQISSLLGVNTSNFGKSSVADILGVTNSDVSLSLLPFSQGSTGQERDDRLTYLEEFIKTNVTDGNADKLLASVEALRSLLNGKATKNNGIDPVFSLLAGSSIAAGSIINELA
ncbi:MAG TPA: hypothetical protein DIV86_04150 [Alphaproteobacteria bacterium]|nr:hypothetical protein [Alphaproteobacteria bacterium]